MQFVGRHVSGVVDYLVRNKEIKLYERLNDQLVKENARLAELLRDERDRYDEVKAQLDNQLKLVVQEEEESNEPFNPIGGYSSSLKRGRKLSLASARRYNESEVSGSSGDGSSSEE